jgi:cyclopropane fatty-acyl-phospholipid synthase-like methyltransferase
MAQSPTWKTLCHEVFGQYVGQLSFTPLTQIQLLAEKLHIEPHSQVLELASGTGGLGLHLVRLSRCHLTGIDSSSLAVKMANEQALLQGLSERAHFEVGVLPELPYPQKSFDAVTSIDSVYIVADKTALLQGCHHTLRPGGHLGFYTLYRRRRFYSETEMHKRALNWFPLHSYSKLLVETGFEEVSKIDFSNDLVRLGTHWIEAMEQNKVALDKELGKRIIDDFLAEVETAVELAKVGDIGRALFIAKKPLQISTHPKTCTSNDFHINNPSRT